MIECTQEGKLFRDYQQTHPCVTKQDVECFPVLVGETPKNGHVEELEPISVLSNTTGFMKNFYVSCHLLPPLRRAESAIWRAVPTEVRRKEYARCIPQQYMRTAVAMRIVYRSLAHRNYFRFDMQ